MKEKKISVSKEELKALWDKSWLLSKGYDKSDNQFDSDYKEEQFQIYFDKIMEK